MESQNTPTMLDYMLTRGLRFTPEEKGKCISLIRQMPVVHNLARRDGLKRAIVYATEFMDNAFFVELLIQIETHYPLKRSRWEKGSKAEDVYPLFQHMITVDGCIGAELLERIIAAESALLLYEAPSATWLIFRLCLLLGSHGSLYFDAVKDEIFSEEAKALRDKAYENAETSGPRSAFDMMVLDMDNKSLQSLIREINEKDLPCAIWKDSYAAMKKISDNLSDVRQRQFFEDCAVYSGNPEKGFNNKSQMKIISVIQKLVDRGEIIALWDRSQSESRMV